jgi:hypothetical protein
LPVAAQAGSLCSRMIDSDFSQSNTMGTSTARRGPITALWRLAKGVATRYMSPEGATPMEAREVVRRYVAALEETSRTQGQDLIAEFRLTRKSAQFLGEFGDTVAASGLPAALESMGLEDLAQLPPEEAIPGLTQAWLEEQDSLEAAVAGTALAACLSRALTPNPAAFPRVDGAPLVRSFLAIVLSQRLVFDLGESLEAAAPDWPEYHQGLVRLHEELAAAAGEVPDNPPEATHWRGLAGWLFVTRTLENILQRYEDDRPAS